MSTGIHLRKRGLVPLVALAIGGLPIYALAQDGADQTQPAQDAAAQVQEPAEASDSSEATSPQRKATEGIEEITVTARKRSEALQDTPIAVTAFNGDSLKDLEIRSLKDVQNNVPNLQFDNSIGSASSSRIYLRGVGNGDASIRDDPGVGLYVDGVYLARAQGTLLTVSDIERVEVLRGPQGTLFGRNTIGGAINVITQKPSFEFGGVAELRAGTGGLFETRAAVDLPLVPEMVAMRISVTTATDNGYTHNRTTGSRVADNKVLGGRVQLLMTPTERSEIQISLDHSRENRAGNVTKCKPLAAPGALFNALAPELREACAIDDATTNDEITRDGPLEDRLRTYGASLTGTFELSDNLTFKSISAWRRNKIGTAGDADGTPFNLTQDQREFGLDKGKFDAISQEFNLNGSGLGGKLNWTTGLYGFYEDNQFNDSTRTLAMADQDLPFRPQDAAPNRIFVPGVGRLLITGNTDAALTFNGLGDCVVQTAALTARGLCGRAFGSVPRTGFLKANTTSYAAYGQFTYDFSDAWSFTAGLRYTHERKRVAEQQKAFGGPRGPFNEGRVNEPAPGDPLFTSNYELSERYARFTPSATLQYRFSDDVNVYGTISRGFKSGGFSADADGQPPQTFEPEVLTNYETGLKSSFFDNRLIANVAGYISYYRDIQLTTVSARDDGTQFVTTLNAGEARILGTEIELMAVPFSGLRLSSAIGITKARYTKFDGGNSNARLPGTPALTMTYSATYTLPLGSLGDLRSTVTWNHQGKKGSDVSDPDITRVNKRGLLSGRLSLEMADGVTEIALFGSNLLNREYFTNAINLGATGITARNYAPPRRLGIEISREF